jgi:hypothetical protein
MPGAEGNDHVKLLDNEGSSKRTDSVLSPRAVEGAERLQGDALATSALDLRDGPAITGFEVSTRSPGGVSASTTDDFSDIATTFVSFDFNEAFPSNPDIVFSFLDPHPGVSAHATNVKAGGFNMVFKNATTSSFGLGDLAFQYIAVSTE